MSRRERVLKDKAKHLDDLEQIKSRLIFDGVILPEVNYMEGTLQHFHPKKQIGFIRGADEKTYFMHVNRITEGQAKRLARVKFRPVEHKSRYIAYDVRPVGVGRGISPFSLYGPVCLNHIGRHPYTKFVL